MEICDSTQSQMCTSQTQPNLSVTTKLSLPSQRTLLWLSSHLNELWTWCQSAHTSMFSTTRRKGARGARQGLSLMGYRAKCASLACALGSSAAIVTSKKPNMSNSATKAMSFQSYFSLLCLCLWFLWPLSAAALSKAMALLAQMRFAKTSSSRNSHRFVERPALVM